jgi:predicted ATPase
MHVKSIRLHGFRRFHDLTIADVPPTARLVVMAGPNGTGKSSILDGFAMWHSYHGAPGAGLDPSYHVRQGHEALTAYDEIQIEFHEPISAEPDEQKKLFYIRSAYRNESDFTTAGLSNVGRAIDGRRVYRMLDPDARVNENYQRIVSKSFSDIFSGKFREVSAGVLEDRYIGQLRDSMQRVFPDLMLSGVGNPLSNGSFYFNKGKVQDFHYKLLSGGEKAAFDLLLDFIVKSFEYDDTVYCIDEPELHMNPRLQADLVGEMMAILPDKSQLWLATHAIGMMRRAADIQRLDPRSVTFLDFEGHDFDESVNITPVEVDRIFWERTLRVALGDLAELVAPKTVVLCEGKPVTASKRDKAEFDAACYRTIFSDGYPETDFWSVGNSADVQSDRLQFAQAMQTLATGTTVIRVIDRDERATDEIAELRRSGVRVLSRRNIEAYLLDDEVLTKLCGSAGRAELSSALIAEKEKAVQQCVDQGSEKDDLKPARGLIYNSARSVLGLERAGNDADSFLRYTLAPLVSPETCAYQELKRDIFG